MSAPLSTTDAENGFDKDRGCLPANINIMAYGDRRALEALYLELRELAKLKGLQIDYRLSVNRPEPGS
jgi:hypothetical protein